MPPLKPGFFWPVCSFLSEDWYDYENQCLIPGQTLTPYEHICKVWTLEPKRFKIDPTHQITGLYT